MAIVDPTTLKLKDHIKFKSISSKDTTAWSGEITSFCTYKDALLREDILPYYREVKKEFVNLAPIEELTFIVLRITENGTTSTFRVMALEYIDKTSLVRNDPYTDLVFTVYGTPATEVKTIITLLAAHGYTARHTA